MQSWVPGTEKISEVGYRWVLGAEEISTYEYRWIPGTEEILEVGYRMRAQHRFVESIVSWQISTPGQEVTWVATWVWNQKDNPDVTVQAVSIKIFINDITFDIIIVKNKIFI